jgi:hypothetical protein
MHAFSVIKISQLIVHKEINCVYYEILTKDRNTHWEWNMELLSVSHGGM